MVSLAVENKLRDLAVSIQLKLNRTVEMTIAIGKELQEARALLPHGDWESWLDENFAWTSRSALNFMRVAERFGDAPEILEGAEMGYRALYALVAPSTSETVRNIALYEAKEGGKPLTPKRVEVLKAEAEEEGVWLSFEGDPVGSLSGSARLNRGDSCLMTGHSFVADPALVYVERDGEVFLVAREALRWLPKSETVSVSGVSQARSLGKRRMPSGDVVEVLEDLGGDRFSVRWPNGDLDDVPGHLLRPLNAGQEMSARARDLGLPTSAVQVLPDVPRNEAPGEVDDRPFAAAPLFKVGDVVCLRSVLPQLAGWRELGKPLPTGTILAIDGLTVEIDWVFSDGLYKESVRVLDELALVPPFEPLDEEQVSIPFPVGSAVVYRGRPDVVGRVRQLFLSRGMVRVDWPINSGVYGAIATSVDLLEAAPKQGYLIEITNEANALCCLPVRFAGSAEELLQVVANLLAEDSTAEVVDVEEQEAAAIAYHMVFGGTDGTD